MRIASLIGALCWAAWPLLAQEPAAVRGAAPPVELRKASPLLPEEEQAAFSVPPGFVIELVAADPDIPKVVTVAFDDSGRMWAVTAEEYPIDANESPREAERLYGTPGRDRVLVFDRPTEPGRQRPRTFADGLAIPLGVLPIGNGAIVPHGSNVFFFKDTDGDGKADQKELLLTGFGVQDSHLLPHQFTLGPGGWVYVAQGAFNYSLVKTRDGLSVPFEQCKLARFKPDGTRFEVVGYGLNNIWGLVIDRQGEFFIQEANDLGYPVVPFHRGAAYPGIGMHRPRPYFSWQPPLAQFAMGGTGLSGLALCDDPASFPAPYQRVMFVANPIIRQIQMIRLIPDGPRWKLERLPDFITTSDPWFRPIAIHFGPDGCLYIVDWYNKIISHNEVPRTHPDRDKVRGRIWRVRHQDMPRRAIPDVARQNDQEMMASLAAENSWQRNAAVHQIIQQKRTGLAPRLGTIVNDSSAPVTLRLAALWALEGLGQADERRLETLTREQSRALRREAVRVLGEQPRDPALIVKIVRPLADDPDPEVRAEVIHCLAGLTRPDDQVLGLLLEMAKPVLAGPTIMPQQGGGPVRLGAAGERDFERSLARQGLEKFPDALAAFLESPAGRGLAPEKIAFAAVTLNNSTGAEKLSRVLPKLERPAAEPEIQLLAAHWSNQGAGEGLRNLLSRRETRLATLTALGNATVSGASGGLDQVLEETARQAWKEDEGPARAPLLTVARKFKLRGLAPETAALAIQTNVSPEMKIAAVRTLRELEFGEVELYQRLALSAKAGEPLQREAVVALAASDNERAAGLIWELWPVLPRHIRKNALAELASSPGRSRRLVSAIEEGRISEAELDESIWKKLAAHLGNGVLARKAGSTGGAELVLRLNGRPGDYLEANLLLDGAFTVEAWVKLDAPINNQDALLGKKGGPDFNFHDGKLRFYGGSAAGDVVIARNATAADAWQHVAVTRDTAGQFRLYLDGELNASSTKKFPDKVEGLQVGQSSTEGGTAGVISEFRVWNRERTADEIKGAFQVRFEPRGETPGLVHLFAGAIWPPTHGEARIERTAEGPPLVSAEEAAKLERRLAAVRTLAAQPGNREHGREIFRNICMTCHNVGGEGGSIGPVLNGAGAKSSEELLRALLTPSAAVESGYYLYRVQTTDREVIDGFFVSQNATNITLRPVAGGDLQIPRSSVQRSGFTRESLMPEGLLDGLKPGEVSDLFAYLKTLR